MKVTIPSTFQRTPGQFLLVIQEGTGGIIHLTWGFPGYVLSLD